MNKTIRARRRYVGRHLSRWALRIRKIALTKNPRDIKIIRPEDTALLARVSAIANLIEAEAAAICEWSRQ